MDGSTVTCLRFARPELQSQCLEHRVVVVGVGVGGMAESPGSCGGGWALGIRLSPGEAKQTMTLGLVLNVPLCHLPVPQVHCPAHTMAELQGVAPKQTHSFIVFF